MTLPYGQNPNSANEGSALEKARMERMQKERNRMESERTKNDIEDKTRKINFNKSTIARHQSDISHLDFVGRQSKNGIENADRAAKNSEEILRQEKNKLGTLKANIQKEKLELDHLTAEFNDGTSRVSSLEQEKISQERQSKSITSTSHETDEKKKRYQADID